MPTETLLLELWAGQPRPGHTHDVITKETVDRLMVPVLKWLRDGQWTGSEEEIRKELTQLIRGRGGLDGYELARSLDSWAPDAELVEILDNTSLHRSLVRTRVTQEWVKDNEATLAPLLARFPVGTRVSWMERQPDLREACVYGVVKTLWPLEAQAVIVQEGKPEKAGCPVVDIEKLSLA